MFLGFKRLNLLLVLFVAIFFSCKNEIKVNNSDFLSTNVSSSLAGANNSLGVESVDLNKYDVKSGLGPVSVTECDLDSSNFQGTVEKFTSGFDKSLQSKYPPISSKEDIKFNSTDKEEIWYVFTNTTGEDKALPEFKIPGGISENPLAQDDSDSNASDDFDNYTKLPTISESGYKRGPGNVDFNKSIYYNGVGNFGKVDLYFYTDYPSDWSLNAYVADDWSDVKGTASKSNDYFSLDKHYFKSRKLKDFIEKYALWLTIDAKKSLSPENKAIYSIFGALGGVIIIASICGGYYASVAGAAASAAVSALSTGLPASVAYSTSATYVALSGPGAAASSILGYSADAAIIASLGAEATLIGSAIADVLYPTSEVFVKINYHQFINMLARRFGAPSLPTTLCWPTFYDNNVKRRTGHYGYDAIDFQFNSSPFGNCGNKKLEFYVPKGFESYYADFNNRLNKSLSIDYSGERSLASSQNYWLTPENEHPNPKTIYNYYPCNYYDYESSFDPNAVYITDGELGFGLYMPKQKWFYPIPVTDGPNGKGYYVKDKLFKLANVDYSVPEDEYYDPSNSLTVNFFNNLNSSSNNIEKLKSNVINRVAKGEEALPLRLVLKEDDNETKAKTDEIKSNLGDKVGGKQDFIEIYSDNNSSYYRQATCRLVRKVDTAFGERYLVIYEEDGLKTHPSDEEYEKIADLFLQGGLNNDIYDKITNVFGSEWGYYNQTFLKSISDKSSEDIPLLKKSNTITLFYTDLANAGDSNEYISSSYIPLDLESSDSSPYSNERLMIHVHAPKATGDYFSESIISLACEFERLIYDQYFSEKLSNYCYQEQLDKFGFERPSDKSGFSDYFFSFLAKVIAANTLRDKNYSIPASYNLFSLEDKSFTNLFGLDKYYLYGMDKFDIGSLNLLAQEGDDFQTIAKAVISSFAYYIYTNFGSGFIREYTLGSKAGLDGIVSAINKVYETSYTLSDLLSSWSIATLDSSKQSKTRPYTFNYLNYFKVQGVQYPNIDFSNAQAYKATEKGVPSSLATTILNNSSACYKVKDSWQGEYEAVAPSLEEGLELRVIRKQIN